MLNQPPINPGFSAGDFAKGWLPAFGEVYAYYYPGLLRMAGELLQDHTVMETIVTDSFLKLWIKHADLTSAQNIEAFLHSSVRRACFSYLKQVEKLTDAQLQRMQEIAAYADSPRKKNDSDTMQRIILGWFSQLPALTAATARLAWGLGLPDEQVAERLGIPAAQVKEQKLSAMLLIMEQWFNKTEKELAAFRHLLEKARE